MCVNLIIYQDYFSYRIGSLVSFHKYYYHNFKFYNFKIYFKNVYLKQVIYVSTFSSQAVMLSQ